MTDAAPIRAIALLSAAAFVSGATLRVADPLLPQLAEEFGATVADASVIATGYTLAYGLSQFVYGPMGDRFGKYSVVAVTTLLSALGTGAAAFAGDLWTLGLLRFLAACTAGAIIPLAMAHIGDIVPYDRRQAMLARFMSGQILGVMAGQAVGGIAGELVGWRGVFLGLGALYLAVAALLAVELRSARRRGPPPTPPSLATLASAYGGLARSAHVRLVLGAVFVEGFLFYGSFTFLGAFLRLEEGLSYGKIGLLLGCFGLGALAYTMIAAGLVRRLGQRGMVPAGGAALALGLGGLALDLPMAVLPVAVALCGLGFYMFHNTLQTLATQMAPATRGIAVSVFASFLFTGQAAGIATGGVIATAGRYGALFAGAGLGLLLLGAFVRTKLARPAAAQG
ncbi:MFS transporter [Arenibaculum sp.]|uniref:MFS transporter n=1 Tax=Arenibaculum sp. TaxID=2865862 RepID=UPI002E112460|nr:MFS transporter [Arenibaculum sp.]